MIRSRERQLYGMGKFASERKRVASQIDVPTGSTKCTDDGEATTFTYVEPY